MCTKLHLFLKHSSNTGNVISKVYTLLVSNSGNNLQALLSGWERDFGGAQEKEKWSNVMQNMRLHKILHCCVIRHKKQFKILHRIHCTPYVLSNINSKRSPVCPKCKSGLGTHSHMFWFCPLISHFWDKIKAKLECILNCIIEKDPWFFILGTFSGQAGKQIIICGL